MGDRFLNDEANANSLNPVGQKISNGAKQKETGGFLRNTWTSLDFKALETFGLGLKRRVPNSVDTFRPVKKGDLERTNQFVETKFPILLLTVFWGTTPNKPR